MNTVAGKKVYYVLSHVAPKGDSPRFYISRSCTGVTELSQAERFTSPIEAALSKNFKDVLTQEYFQVRGAAIIRVEEIPGTTSVIIAKDTRRVDMSKPVVVFEPYFAPHYLKASGYSGTLQQAKVFADGAEAIQQILDWSRELDWQDEVTHLINVETLTTDTQYIETVLA